MPKPLNREHNAWRAMNRRCYEPNFRSYPRYGGAGIVVFTPWRMSFQQFLNDMGPAPSQAHWLGRSDVKGNYEPGNCLWTTQPEQERRRTFCRRVTLYGQVLTAAEAGRLPGQPTRNSVLRRAVNGLPIENPPAVKLYRRSIWIFYKGENLPLPEWVRRTGIPRWKLHQRIKAGWPPELALNPERQRFQKSDSSAKTSPSIPTPILPACAIA